MEKVDLVGDELYSQYEKALKAYKNCKEPNEALRKAWFASVFAIEAYYSKKDAQKRALEIQKIPVEKKIKIKLSFKQKRALINNIEDQIASCADSCLNNADWEWMEGILISANEAQVLVEVYKKSLHKSHTKQLKS